MYEAAIFDFGGVVTTSIADAFGRLDESVGVAQGTVLRLMREARDAETSAFHRLETGAMTEADFYAALGEAIASSAGRDIDWPSDPKQIRRVLFGSLRRNEEMLAAIAAIGRAYKVGMLTNNVREWAAWRDHYPMDLFEVVIDSCEVGMRKPDPRIYRLACERLGVAPERAVFVDDLPVNVDGAAAVGMRGVLFTTTDDTLDALRGLLPRAFVEQR